MKSQSSVNELALLEKIFQIDFQGLGCKLEVLVLGISQDIVIETSESDQELSSQTSNEVNPLVVTLRVPDVKDSHGLRVECFLNLRSPYNMISNLIFKVADSKSLSGSSSLLSHSSFLLFFLLLNPEFLLLLLISSLILIVNRFFVSLTLLSHENGKEVIIGVLSLSVDIKFSGNL